MHVSMSDPQIAAIRERAEALIGADELKQYLDDLIGLYGRLGEKCPEVVFDRALLLSVNEGDGIGTWCGLIADLWCEMLLAEDLPVKRYTLKLPDLMDAGSIHKTSERDIVLHTLEEDGILESFMGRRLLCVDISKWVDRIDGPEFRAALSRFRLSMEEQFVAFRIPAVDAMTLRHVREAIGWFMNVDELYCPPFSIDDYLAYGMRCFREADIRTGMQVEERLREIIEYARRDRGFCGFRTVRRITDSIIWQALKEKYAQ